MLLLYFLFFILLCSHYANLLQIRVLHTPILGVLPQLRQHHIVLVTLSKEQKDHYTIDFSPLYSGRPETLLSLLFAKNVPAEIRARRIIDANDDDTIIEKWNQINAVDHLQSQCISNRVLQEMKHLPMKAILEKINRWNSTDSHMNLYFRNCQHFSHFISS